MMEFPAQAARILLPLILPICIWVMASDLKAMRIRNKAVIALAAVFILIGPLTLPLSFYLWQLVHLIVILVVGIILNAAGGMGAGDAKFAAAAAPYIALGDLRLLMALFAANLLAAFVTHRIAKYTRLRNLAPNWTSWQTGSDFPMGLSLGATLVLYLALAALYGS